MTHGEGKDLVSLNRDLCGENDFLELFRFLETEKLASDCKKASGAVLCCHHLFHGLLHLLESAHLDLADTLARDAELF